MKIQTKIYHNIQKLTIRLKNQRGLGQNLDQVSDVLVVIFKNKMCIIFSRIYISHICRIIIEQPRRHLQLLNST